MNDETIFLGIDPGIGICGYGLVARRGSRYRCIDCGCIRTTPRAPLSSRLLELASDLERLLDACSPHAAGVEKVFFGHNVTNAMAVSHARGVVLYLLASRGIPVMEFSPPQIKQAVAGYGNADKRQVQYMVVRLLGLEAAPRPDDAADALAVALCSAFHDGAVALAHGGA